MFTSIPMRCNFGHGLVIFQPNPSELCQKINITL